ncbi:MAG TPA: carbonate dehydratase [Lacipirellulaceae bacterium]|nr:carbonate dehydratase [Lacipirellulaceae bacterium]
MRTLSHLFTNNQAWAAEISEETPDFFARLARQQSPEYLWIGCADSRVPANQIVRLLPGELFVHRNIANVVVHTDLNCLSVLQYAVDVLRVRHVIVCGHYECGGVLAALRGDRFGLIDNWLRHVQDVRDKYRQELDACSDEPGQHRRLCELNVVEQVMNIARTTIVRDAWERSQDVTIHGWIYGVHNGLLRDLDVCIGGSNEFEERYAHSCTAPVT